MGLKCTNIFAYKYITIEVIRAQIYVYELTHKECSIEWERSTVQSGVTLVHSHLPRLQGHVVSLAVVADDLHWPGLFNHSILITIRSVKLL